MLQNSSIQQFRFKKLILILFSVICMFSGFSQESEKDFEAEKESQIQFDETDITKNNNGSIVNWFTFDVPTISLDGSVKVNNYHNFLLYTLSTAVTIEMDMNELGAKTGVDFSPDQINFTLQANYAPTLFDVLNVGAILINHFSWSYYNYYEFDFLTGLYVKYNPVNWFELNFTGLYQLKCTRIFDLADTSCPEFRSNCPAFSLGFAFYPLDWFSATLSVSSYEFYRYYIFLAPITSLKLSFKCNENLTMNVLGEIQFVDFFTLSANFNSLSAVVSATWRF